MKSNEMSAYFDRLKDHNERHPLLQDIKQRLSPPVPFAKGIPALEKGIYRSPTPMIQSRMQYAGDWVNAFPGFTWLSVPSMEKAWASRKIKAQLALRREHWAWSAFAKTDPRDISLFAIDPLEFEETYLRWGRGEEPEILFYTGSEESKYKNLRSFVRALLRG